MKGLSDLELVLNCILTEIKSLSDETRRTRRVISLVNVINIVTLVVLLVVIIGGFIGK